MNSNGSDPSNHDLDDDPNKRGENVVTQELESPIQKFWNDRKLRSRINESCLSFSESIIRPAADRGANIVGFVGEKENVGNSTVALFAAVFNALTRNLPTVLVDCNFRKPVMKNWFKIDAPSGISNVMEDPSEIEIATRTTSYHNLSVIHQGTQPKRLRFEPEKLGPIFSSLSLEFPNVFVDLPAFDPSHIPLYSNVDFAVLVSGPDTQSDQRSVQLISETLADHAVPFAGVFINERP